MPKGTNNLNLRITKIESDSIIYFHVNSSTPSYLSYSNTIGKKSNINVSQLEGRKLNEKTLLSLKKEATTVLAEALKEFESSVRKSDKNIWSGNGKDIYRNVCITFNQEYKIGATSVYIPKKPEQPTKEDMLMDEILRLYVSLPILENEIHFFYSVLEKIQKKYKKSK